MDARGRARLGAERPGATAHRSRRRGRQRQSGRLGLPGPQLSLDRIGRPAAHRFTAGRDQGRRARRPERHRRRRRHVHLRESEDRGRGHSLGEARSHSAAHFAAARSRRPGARVRQRIVHGRTRVGCQCRSASVPAAIRREEPARRRLPERRRQAGELAGASRARAGGKRQHRQRAGHRRKRALHDRRGGHSPKWKSTGRLAK